MPEAETPQMICPNCNKEIHLSYVATVPEKQVLHMKLTSSTGAWSAKTVGGVIIEFDKLLKAVAKDVGGKVHVFIESIERGEKDLDIGFLIATVPTKQDQEP